jgi:hypothetical protein
MLSMTHPWKSATMRDDCFKYYLTNPKYLYNTLPISKETYRILINIFDLNPETRSTIPEIKQQIEQVATFFRPADLTTNQADWSVSALYASISGSSSFGTVASILGGTRPVAPVRALTLPEDVPSSNSYQNVGMEATGTSAKTKESALPLTPVTRAIDPNIVVSNFVNECEAHSTDGDEPIAPIDVLSKRHQGEHGTPAGKHILPSVKLQNNIVV